MRTEAARGTQEVNSNITGVQRAADETAASQVLGAVVAVQEPARQVNRFLSAVRAALAGMEPKRGLAH